VILRLVLQLCTGHFCVFFQFNLRNEIGPAFSGSAFSTPAFLVLHFSVVQSSVFSPAFSGLSFSGLAFSYPGNLIPLFQSCRLVFDDPFGPHWSLISVDPTNIVCHTTGFDLSYPSHVISSDRS